MFCSLAAYTRFAIRNNTVKIHSVSLSGVFVVSVYCNFPKHKQGPRHIGSPGSLPALQLARPFPAFLDYVDYERPCFPVGRGRGWPLASLGGCFHCLPHQSPLCYGNARPLPPRRRPPVGGRDQQGGALRRNVPLFSWDCCRPLLPPGQLSEGSPQAQWPLQAVELKPGPGLSPRPPAFILTHGLHPSTVTKGMSVACRAQGAWPQPWLGQGVVPACCFEQPQAFICLG